MTWRRYKLNLRNSLLSEEYFRVMEQFDSTLSSVIDSTLGIRDFFIFCEFAFDLYKRDIRLPVAS